MARDDAMRPPPGRDELERLWRDPAHWRIFDFYYCPEDPRVVVPKRVRWMGWTLNFAHPWAVPLLIFFIALAAGPMLAFLAAGVTSAGVLIAVCAASVLTVVALTVYLATHAY